MLLFLAAASSVTLATPLPPAAGLAYAEAYERAERYERTDNGAMRFRTGVLYPWLGPSIPRILDTCAPRPKPADLPLFTLVLSYRDGRFDAVQSSSDHPVAQCIVKQMSTLAWPAPPFPDFAEQMHFDLKDKAE